MDQRRNRFSDRDDDNRSQGSRRNERCPCCGCEREDDRNSNREEGGYFDRRRREGFSDEGRQSRDYDEGRTRGQLFDEDRYENDSNQGGFFDRESRQDRYENDSSRRGFSNRESRDGYSQGSFFDRDNRYESNQRGSSQKKSNEGKEKERSFSSKGPNNQSTTPYNENEDAEDLSSAANGEDSEKANQNVSLGSKEDPSENSDSKTRKKRKKAA